MKQNIMMQCTRPDLRRKQGHLKTSQNQVVVIGFPKIVVLHKMELLNTSLNYKKPKNNLRPTDYSEENCASSEDRHSTTGYYFTMSITGPAYHRNLGSNQLLPDI